MSDQRVAGRRAHVLYRERLLPSPWLLLAGAAFLASFGVAVGAALGVLAGAATGVLVVAAGAWLVTVASPVVAVTADELCAGRAHLPLAAVGRARPLDAAATSRLAGPDADRTAFLVLRGWVATSVAVEIVDRADPTPYWQLSTRHPRQLVAALESARPSGPL